MAINENLKKTLQNMHAAATAANQPFSFANPKAPAVSNLLNSGHLAADHDYKDPADPAKVAVAVTDLGKAELGPVATSGPVFGQPTPPEATADDLEQEATRKPRGPRVIPVIHAVTSRMQMPDKAPRSAAGGKTESYPFSTLGEPNEDGHDSFFVEATPEMPNPAKSLGGTVSSANKRNKVDGIEQKKFAVTAGTHPDTGKTGAFVWRTI